MLDPLVLQIVHHTRVRDRTGPWLAIDHVNFQDFDESSEVSNECNCTFKMSGAASLRNVAVWMFHSKFLAINQDIASNESWSRKIDLYFSFEKLNRPRLWWSPSYRSRRTRRATSSSGSSRTFWYFRNIDTSKKWYLKISVIFLY